MEHVPALSGQFAKHPGVNTGRRPSDLQKARGSNKSVYVVQRLMWLL
jgi:hypothetical protein